MKNIFSVFLISSFAYSLIGTSAFAQSFEKGNRIFDINLGLAVYNTSFKDNQSGSSSTSKAACSVLAPAMEWAVGKRISIGTSLVYSSYLAGKDSVSGTKPTVKGLDGNFLFNFHFVKSRRTDLFTGLRAGIAGIRYNPKDGTGSIYGSMGRSFDFHIAGRFYVSDKIGIIVNLAFPSYTFSKFGDSLNYTYTFKLSGFCFGTGIAIKLRSNSQASSPAGK